MVKIVNDILSYQVLDGVHHVEKILLRKVWEIIIK